MVTPEGFVAVEVLVAGVPETRLIEMAGVRQHRRPTLPEMSLSQRFMCYLGLPTTTDTNDTETRVCCVLGSY